MKLFAIHGAAWAAGQSAIEAARPAKTGFSWGALLFGPIWLVARGLWLALSAYVLAVVAVVLLGQFGFVGPGVAVALFLLGQLYLGVEGRALAIVARARNGRPLIDVVYARSALEAEKLYLDRALSKTAPPVSRAGEEIVGLFPEAGR